MKIKSLTLQVIILCILSINSFAEDKKSGLKFYTGMFDFSDEGAKSQLFGVQHQNSNLYRDTFLGQMSPITGAMITADNAVYLYSGIETNYSIGLNVSVLDWRLITETIEEQINFGLISAGASETVNFGSLFTN